MGNQQTQPIDENARRKDIQKMDEEISRKLSKGMNWNLKVIIRGSRGSGKTSLLRRLQGCSFVEDYTPSPEISTTHINWSYKNSFDNIKVEVWDIVDSADRNVTPQDSRDLPLDATTVNVYRGTNAVIMIFNPMDRQSWEYVTQEIPFVPADISILVMANFRDVEAKRQVKQSDIDSFLKTQGNKIKYLEASMKNCFGLKSLKSFLNLPFLALQQDYYESKLQGVLNDIKLATNEFDLIVETDTYENYMTLLSTRSPPPSKQSSPQLSSHVEKPTLPSKEALKNSYTKTIQQPTSPKETVDELLKLKQEGKKQKNLKSIDDFAPEFDDDWFQGSQSFEPKKTVRPILIHHDDSDEDSNPAIASYDDNVEIDYNFSLDTLNKETTTTEVSKNEKLNFVPMDRKKETSKSSEKKIESPEKTLITENKTVDIVPLKLETNIETVNIDHDFPQHEDTKVSPIKNSSTEVSDDEEWDKDRSLHVKGDADTTKSSESAIHQNFIDTLNDLGSFEEEEEQSNLPQHSEQYTKSFNPSTAIDDFEIEEDDDFWNDDSKGVSVAILETPNETEEISTFMEFDFRKDYEDTYEDEGDVEVNNLEEVSRTGYDTL